MGACRTAGAVALAALALAGCRCAGGGTGTPCRTNGECAPGLYCAPGAGLCMYVPAPSDARADAGGGTDAAPPGTDALPPGTDAGPVCGNGVVEPGEQCDAVNVACDGACQVSASACAAGVGALMCGSTVSGSNDMAGSTDLASDYGSECANHGVLGETGPEVAYAFLPAESGLVTFDLGGLSSDLDVAVLAGEPACAPDTCIDGQGSGGSNAEQVTVTVTAGVAIFVVVEGYAGNVSSFTLSATCEGAGG